eukprot:4046687-Amphidinium_carterae.1
MCSNPSNEGPDSDSDDSEASLAAGLFLVGGWFAAPPVRMRGGCVRGGMVASSMKGSVAEMGCNWSLSESLDGRCGWSSS